MRNLASLAEKSANPEFLSFGLDRVRVFRARRMRLVSNVSFIASPVLEWNGRSSGSKSA
jgi:hypothetical protein